MDADLAALYPKLAPILLAWAETYNLPVSSSVWNWKNERYNSYTLALLPLGQWFFLISNMLQLDDGRLLLPQGEGWDEGIK